MAPVDQRNHSRMRRIRRLRNPQGPVQGTRARLALLHVFAVVLASLIAYSDSETADAPASGSGSHSGSAASETPAAGGSPLRHISTRSPPVAPVMPGPSPPRPRPLPATPRSSLDCRPRNMARDYGPKSAHLKTWKCLPRLSLRRGTKRSGSAKTQSPVRNLVSIKDSNGS